MGSKTTTSELIDAIAGETPYPKNEIKAILQAFTQVTTDNLRAGNSVAVTDLGTFKPTQRAERMGRNPQTGEALKIAASNGAGFSAAKSLKDALN